VLELHGTLSGFFKLDKKNILKNEFCFFSEHTHEDISLQRTGKLFGGLIADVKRKAPWYWSDFRDAFHVQSLASIIYIYLVKFGVHRSDVETRISFKTKCQKSKKYPIPLTLQTGHPRPGPPRAPASLG
jgi:hypothetical protein